MSLTASEPTGREPSCPPIAGDIRHRLWLSQARRLVLYFPGCCSPKPAVHGRSRRHPRGKPTRRPRLPQITPPSAAHRARRSREMMPPSAAHRARRSREMTPPARRWLKPAGSPLTHARRPPLTLAPWIQSTRHGQECRVCLVVPTGTFKKNLVLSCPRRLVWAGGSSCCGRGGHSSRLPRCRRGGSGCWGTLWGPLTPCHAQRKPQLPSQPRRASGSCGMSCPVCLALEGFFLSCYVIYCPVCLAPEGSWYPREIFFGGRKGSGCGGRAEGTEAKAPKTTCHGLLSSQLRHGLLSSLHRHDLLSSWCQSSVVCVMCSRLLCPYLVCFLSSSDVIISSFLSSCDCVNYPVYLVPVFWVRFRLVYSLLPVFPVCQPCLVLPCPH